MPDDLGVLGHLHGETPRAELPESDLAVPRRAPVVDLGALGDDQPHAPVPLARLLGTRVHLVHVYPSRSPLASAATEVVSSPAPNPEILEGIRSELDALASHIRASGIGCDADVLDGDVADVIIAKADEIDAELIVMAMHRRDRFGKAAVAGVTQRVLMRTTRPLLALPPLRSE